MNLQYVIGVYTTFTYLTQSICKPGHAVGELIKKASKEAYGKDNKGNVRFLHIKQSRVLSLPMRYSNIDVLYVPSGLKKDRTRVLKSISSRKDGS